MDCIFIERCKNKIEGFGNNARPFEGRCCNQCNELVVIPLRMLMMMGKIDNLDELLVKMDKVLKK